MSLIVGIVTPLGAAAAAGIVLQFIAGPQWDGGLFGNATAGGFEFSLGYFVAAISVAFIGPGRISLDARIGWRLEGTRWGLIALAVTCVVGAFVLEVWGVGLGGTPPIPGP